MRKLLLAALVGLLLGSCTWQQHRGNAGHTGFQPSETRISTATVASVGEIWTAALPPSASPPVVAGGRVYVGGGDYPNGRGAIMAFDAAGEEGCSGTPRTCSSLWHETTSSGISSTPAVVNGVLYAADEMGGLLAHDAEDGTLIWSADSGVGAGGTPTVANGVVYVGNGEGRVSAYAVRWEGRCDVNPGGFRICPPLWTASTEGGVYGPVSVAGGSVYAISETGVLHAYDAAGQANCSGSPRVCEPLWTADVGDHSVRVSSTPVASDGTVYVVDPARRLWAFDGAGIDNCSGAPRHCGPRWTADLPPTSTTFPLDSPAVANGRVYAGSAVYDADGVTGCAGHPTVCSPLWLVDGGGPFPVVANDVELTGGGLGSGDLPVPLHAFDANGAAACAGTPAVCGPLWTFEPPGPVYDSPAVQSGVVYIVVSGNPGQFEPARLHALSPP